MYYDHHNRTVLSIYLEGNIVMIRVERSAIAAGLLSDCVQSQYNESKSPTASSLCTSLLQRVNGSLVEIINDNGMPSLE